LISIFDARNRGRWLAASLGLFLPLAFAPFGIYPVALILPALLFATWEGQHPREAALRGFLFGFVAFAAGAYWIYISIRGFGQAPMPVVVVLMLGGFFLMGLYPALAGFLAAAVAVESRVWRWCLCWPAVFTLVEWLRTWVFFGFPWLSLGYGQIDGPLRAWGPVVGVHGVTFLALVLSGAGLTFVRGQRSERIAAAIMVGLVVITTAALHDRAWTTPSGNALRVSLVQGSIPQDRKWTRAQFVPTLRLYRDLTLAESNRDLIVWPEAAIPAIEYQVRDYLDDIDAEAKRRGVQVYLGILTRDLESGQYRNSVIGLGPDHGEYHKRHLVPFGEFFPVPDFARAWMRSAGLPADDTLAGERDQLPLPLGTHALAPSICFEDAFGAEQLDFLPAADMLINVSNDAWFGDSIAPHQHLQIAQMRSLESGRPMLRATNTGITAIIGPDGRIVARSRQFETEVLRGEIVPHSGSTPYIRFGNWPIISLCLLLLGGAAFFARRREIQ
jgi:apolipoprotein N-acyltransferase